MAGKRNRSNHGWTSFKGVADADGKTVRLPGRAERRTRQRAATARLHTRVSAICDRMGSDRLPGRWGYRG
jgi:hypothetical protein